MIIRRPVEFCRREPDGRGVDEAGTLS